MTGGDAAAYAQPAPGRLYVHDDLTGLAREQLGAGAPGVALAERLIARLRGDPAHVTVLTLEEQLACVAAQGPHTPFDLAVGIGRAGERVAQQLHARTGWFPRIVVVRITREEDGRGGYALASTGAGSLAEQVGALDRRGRLAVVDDTVFSGLTLRGVLGALSAEERARTRAFCLRGVGETLAGLAALCPVTAGVAAPGRLLTDVSFINASGLVLRIAIRRRGQPALAFFDRPEWLRAWFPGYADDVLALCRDLNALLDTPLPREGEREG